MEYSFLDLACHIPLEDEHLSIAWSLCLGEDNCLSVFAVEVERGVGPWVSRFGVFNCLADDYFKMGVCSLSIRETLDLRESGNFDPYFLNFLGMIFVLSLSVYPFLIFSVL